MKPASPAQREKKKRAVAEEGEKKMKEMLEDLIRKGGKEEEPRVKEGKILDRKKGMEVKIKNELDNQDLKIETKNINKNDFKAALRKFSEANKEEDNFKKWKEERLAKKRKAEVDSQESPSPRRARKKGNNDKLKLF